MEFRKQLGKSTELSAFMFNFFLKATEAHLDVSVLEQINKFPFFVKLFIILSENMAKVANIIFEKFIRSNQDAVRYFDVDLRF